MKAVAMGLATVTGVVLVMSIPVLESMLKYRANDGYFVVAHWHFLPLLSISVPVFSIGFLWYYRRKVIRDLV